MAPSGRDFAFVLYITVFFSMMIGLLGLKLNVKQIKDDWPKNRCNPIYMPFADDIETNFVHCMQTTATAFSPFLLEPLHELTKSVADIASSNMFSINALRIANSNFRGSMMFNFSSIMDSMININISFQKNSIAIQDIIGKITGVALTIMYLVDTTISTLGSTWNGPPGQLLRKIGSTVCFHPNTVVKKYNKKKNIYESIFIKHCQKGNILENGSVVVKRLIFYNIFETVFYRINNILVTGSHKIYSNKYNKILYVSEHEHAIETNLVSEWLICLITSNHRIFIDNYEFMDWEDDDC